MDPKLDVASVHGMHLRLNGFNGFNEARILRNTHRTHKFRLQLGYRTQRNCYVRVPKLFRKLSAAMLWLEELTDLPEPGFGKPLRLTMKRASIAALSPANTLHGRRQDGFSVRLYPHVSGGYCATLFDAKHETHVEATLCSEAKAREWLRTVRVPKL